MKTKFIITILIAAAIVLIFLEVDLTINDGLYFNNMYYKKDCTYEVPEGYQIVYSTEIKKYAVKVLQREDYYLYNGSYGIRCGFSSIAGPALFYDSCTAKAYLKSYLEDQRPKFK